MEDRDWAREEGTSGGETEVYDMESTWWEMEVRLQLVTWGGPWTQKEH